MSDIVEHMLKKKNETIEEVKKIVSEFKRKVETKS